MNNNLYQKVEQFVIDSFTNTGKIQSIKHFLRTVYWLKELEPEADEAMKIAAVAHDIERAFRQADILEIQDQVGFTDLAFLRLHQERGAEIIANFLIEQNADNQTIEKVKMLIARHEEGGNKEQNILKDADSLSFFENNAENFINKIAVIKGKDKVQAKFDWMFERISSDKAKKIAQKWYDDSIRKLLEKS
jgi:hypothetical protein